MKYMVYLLAGVFCITFSYGTEKNILNTATYKPVQKQQAVKKEDYIITIAGLLWHSDIDTAFSIAENENKQVIVMVGEDYCKWCQKMKETTFNDVRIKEKLSKYTLVSVKRSDKSAIKHVPTFDGNIPSLFFMTTQRELIEPVVGYFGPDDLLSYIQEIEEI